jgi:hypothetical protein
LEGADCPGLEGIHYSSTVDQGASQPAKGGSCPSKPATRADQGKGLEAMRRFGRARSVVVESSSKSSPILEARAPSKSRTEGNTMDYVG